jgi:hypothetical protein
MKILQSASFRSPLIISRAFNPNIRLGFIVHRASHVCFISLHNICPPKQFALINSSHFTIENGTKKNADADVKGPLLLSHFNHSLKGLLMRINLRGVQWRLQSRMLHLSDVSLLVHMPRCLRLSLKPKHKYNCGISHSQRHRPRWNPEYTSLLIFSRVEIFNMNVPALGQAKENCSTGCRVYRVTTDTECCRLRLKCDGTRAETRFCLSAKGASPFKSAGRQFSPLLAAEVCASAVIMLDTPCSEVV